MAIDTSIVTTASEAVSAAIQQLFDFADEQIKAATGETEAIKAAIAADEASAVSVLSQVADHLNALAASITTFIASRQPAPVAPPAAATAPSA